MGWKDVITNKQEKEITAVSGMLLKILINMSEVKDIKDNKHISLSEINKDGKKVVLTNVGLKYANREGTILQPEITEQEFAELVKNYQIEPARIKEVEKDLTASVTQGITI